MLAIEHLHQDDRGKHGEYPRKSSEVINGFLGSYREELQELAKLQSYKVGLPRDLLGTS